VPRVSVILPNYNYARYLRPRIRSIVAQTMSDFELIYLDDASKDESNLVIQDFTGDPRISLHLFETNSGVVYQRWNEGAAMARGEWLWFAGADDSAHPRFLECMLAHADKNPTSAIVHTRTVWTDGAGRITADKWHGDRAIMAHMEEDYFARGFDETVTLTEGCYLTTASSLIIRRDAFEQAGGFDLRLRQSADWNLYLTILRHHDIAYSAEPLGYYRYHASAVTKNTKTIVRLVEDAYCTARTYKWLSGDGRCSQAGIDIVHRRLRARVFDLFADPETVISQGLQFAADEIYSVMPDKRLRALAEA
jgi:glycosyltransferase involved in cell wall biosynthesis